MLPLASFSFDVLPDRINDVMAERFALALLALLVAFWLVLRKQPRGRPRRGAKPAVKVPVRSSVEFDVH